MFYFDDTKKYPIQTESRVKIRFQDCDPLQHLNNAKYFDYYFNARDDQVPKLYNVEMADIFLAYKAAWVVYNHQISYLRPATIGEWVRVYSSILWFDQNTVVVEYYMTDDQESHLKNILWSTLKFVGVKDGRKVDHPEDVLKFLNATKDPKVDFKNITLSGRIKNIKEKYQ
ncbi:MAG: acyl-CoA thioesterase [bacterium]|nr:acyl-CoA thioesterase [bacterium]